MFTSLCATLSHAQAPQIDDAVAAWSLVRQWVDHGSVPAPREGLGPDVQGVAVVLRSQGHLIGADWAHKATGSSHPLSEAARGALTEALADHRFASLLELQQDDAPDLRTTVLSRLAVEVELVGDPVPLTGPTDLLEQAVHPMHDGIATRRGNAWHMLFPSQLRRVGRGATARTISASLVHHGVNEVEADAMRRAGEASVYRLEGCAVGQLRVDDLPGLIRRSQDDATSVHQVQDVRRLVDRLAKGLHAFSCSANDGQVLQQWFGDRWSPHKNGWDKPLATDRDVALAAVAASAHAQARGSTSGDLTNAMRQLRASAADDPATAALLVIAAHNAGLQDTVTDEVRLQAIAACTHEDAQIQAMGALAAMHLGDADAVDTVIDAWAAGGIEPVRRGMPWAATVIAASGHPVLEAHANLLRELLLATQLGQDNRMGPSAAGALSSTPEAGSLGLPSLRQAMVLSHLIRHGDPEERVWLRDRLFALATHLQRRTIASETARQWATPGRVANCVRLAPWDERVSISAQAMALLTALQIEAALAQEHE